MPFGICEAIAAIGTAASVGGTIAKIAGGNPDPNKITPNKLTPGQTSVASSLATSFGRDPQSQGPLTGQPTLGQGLAGPLNTTQNLRERLNGVGQDLQGLVSRTPTKTSIQPQ